MNAVEEILKLNEYIASPITRESSKYSAIIQAAERLVGVLIVFEAGKLFGILPESDSYRKVYLTGDSFKETWLRQNMTRTVNEDSLEQILELCLSLTQEKGIRHLPVVVDGHLIGIISLKDLANAVLMEVA